MSEAAESSAAAPFSPAADLGEAYRKLKERRIRVSVARSTRAGSIGHECERYIYYERTVPAAERVAHSVERQELFDLGNALEPWVVREIEEAGCEIVGRQRDWFDAELEIGARADVRVVRPGWPHPVVTEVKGVSPYAVEKIRTVQDIRDHANPWVRRYYDQEQIYLRFDGGDVGLFALANKLSGHVEFVDCPRDPERIAHLGAKAARIRDAVRAGTPPPRNESEQCTRCPFVAICGPGQENAGVMVLDDVAAAEAAELIGRRLELAEAKSEFESIDRRLKALLPEVPELLVGDFVVTARQVRREGYTVAASSYWQRSYSCLSTPTNDRSH